MSNVSVGISTKLGVGFAVVAALKPVVDQIVALVENTSANWSKGDKVSIITAAAVAGVTILSRGAQSVAQVVKGQDGPEHT